MSNWPPVVSRELVQERLELIFPREAFDTVYSSPAAAAAVAVMLYCGAVYDSKLDTAQQRWVRPATIIWMRERAFGEREADDEREQFYRMSIGSRAEASIAELMASWEITDAPWYGMNSRETIRDDILRHWNEFGVVAQRAGLPSNSSLPRWALRPQFAKLFDPALSGDALQSAIDAWVKSELTASAKIRLESLRARQQADHAVLVQLPSGVTRQLEPGRASRIIKGVVEEWAPRRLRAPLVLAISEPGEKTAHVDMELLGRIGLMIDAARLLPDLLIADGEAEPVEMWVIEVVHTDGEINEARKRDLMEWGAQFGIEAGQMCFLTAFESRNSAPAKRRLKDLAVGTFAWYADEPGQELYFGPIEEPSGPATLAIVKPLR